MVPLFGIGLQGKSPVINAQKRQNLYYEFQKDQDRTQVAVYGTPGLDLFLTYGDTPVRGSWSAGNFLYQIHRGTFWQVNNAGVAISKGTLATVEGFVDMVDNGNQILIVDGSDGYIYDLTYDTFSQIKQYSTGTTTGATAGKLVDSGATFQSDGVVAGQIVYNTTDSTTATVTAVDSETQLSLNNDIFTSGENYEVGSDGFPDNVSTCAYQDGYFIVSNTDNDRFHISGINQGYQWDALDFASAESSPDGLVRVISDHGELMLFGENTVEFWGNSGGQDFPFSRIQGAANEWGLAAKWSLTKYVSSLAFLAKNRMGEVIVVKMNGYQPARISDFEFEHIINNYTDVSDAVAFGYMLGGHPMYQINFPSADASWLYDDSTGVWTELKSDGIERHRAQRHVQYLNQNIVTDFETGQVFRLKPDVYTDNGSPIQRVLRSKHLFADENKVIVDMLQIVMETGVGLSAGQGSDPKMMLRFSKDGGQTWSTQLLGNIGKIGKYATRCLWRRLGAGRDWVFEISISDPIKVALAGVNLRARAQRF